MSVNDFWQKQYELIAKLLSDESNRFWTRFNMSLLINGGLVVAFATLLTNMEKIPFFEASLVSIFGISILGIITCIIWGLIINAGRGAQDRLNALGTELENKYADQIPVKYFGGDHRDKLKGFLTKRSLLYPIVFGIFWSVLIVVMAYNLIRVP